MDVLITTLAHCYVPSMRINGDIFLHSGYKYHTELE